MVIQLDRILEDISKENVLHPNYPNADKKSLDDAWDRVGLSNKLTKHEVRSIFKVLQKKYEQEKLKPQSTWRLYDLMEDIYNKTNFSKVKEENDSDTNNDDDEEYEVFDVQEEEGAGAAAASTSAVSETASEKSAHTPEKVVATAVKPNENIGEQKILNVPPKVISPPASAATTPIEGHNKGTSLALLQKKGITLKKTTQVSSTEAAPSGSKSSASTNKLAPRALGTPIGNKPVSTKRKFTDEPTAPIPAKRPVVSQVSNPTTTSATNRKSVTTTAQASAGNESYATEPAKKEDIHLYGHVTDPSPPALQSTQQLAAQNINVITIPAAPTRADLTNGIVTGCGGPSSSTAATVASTSTNGYSPPRIEDIDFRNDIIFDPTGINMNVNNGAATNTAGSKIATNTGSIVNLGNFDNSLPPTFFKNLCNSSRYEALGLYVANVMNRLSTRSAAKLEVNILRAVIDAQSDELEQ